MSPGGAKPPTSPAAPTPPAHLLQGGVAVPQREEFLVLGPLQHADDAPGDVVVDRCLLPGPPDHGQNREPPVGLDVQGMG